MLSGYERMTGRRVVGVGLDSPSLDNGPSTLFPTHTELAAANIYGIENLADLSVSVVQVASENSPLRRFPFTGVCV